VHLPTSRTARHPWPGYPPGGGVNVLWIAVGNGDREKSAGISPAGGFEHGQGGDPAASGSTAATIAQQVLDRSPANSEALLLLGLAQRATGAPAATGTLRRFPARHRTIRRLLGEM
jgi:hypothetical protein